MNDKVTNRAYDHAFDVRNTVHDHVEALMVLTARLAELQAEMLEDALLDEDAVNAVAETMRTLITTDTLKDDVAKLRDHMLYRV